MVTDVDQSRAIRDHLAVDIDWQRGKRPEGIISSSPYIPSPAGLTRGSRSAPEMAGSSLVEPGHDDKAIYRDYLLTVPKKQPLCRRRLHGIADGRFRRAAPLVHGGGSD